MILRRGSGAVASVMLAALVLHAGCGPPPALGPPLDEPPPDSGAADRCEFGPPVEQVGGEIHVGLTEPVDWSHAPVPTNDAERFVFRQCYETLVTVDCRGRVQRGLATRWESDPEGRVWTFTLAPRRRFWDGDEADAFAVARALRRVHETDGNLPPEFRWIVPESVVSLDEGRISLALTDLGMQLGSVRLFAHPALAVASFRGSRIIPVGTGALAAVPGETGDVTFLWPRPPDRYFEPEELRRGSHRPVPPPPVPRVLPAAPWLP